MNRHLIGAIGMMALAISAAAVTLALILRILPILVQIGSGSTVALPADQRVDTIHHAGSASPWALARTGLSSASGYGLLSGAADGTDYSGAGRTNIVSNRATGRVGGNPGIRVRTNFATRFAAYANPTRALGVGNSTIGRPLAPATAVKALAAYTYYRSVAAVMAVFGIIAIVTGCIAMRRQSTTHSQE